MDLSKAIIIAWIAQIVIGIFIMVYFIFGGIFCWRNPTANTTQVFKHPIWVLTLQKKEMFQPDYMPPHIHLENGSIN